MIPTFGEMEIFAFGSGVIPPSSSSNTLRTKACKLFNFQSQPNRKLENQKMKMNVGSHVIVDVIKEFSINVKEFDILNYGDD